ncbi:MAG: pyridoxal-phosphate dependent enzyme [Bacteroidia bacterium]
MDKNPSSESSPEPPGSYSYSLVDLPEESLDFATPETLNLEKTVDHRRATLSERLEAFEDLFDSEVGDTSLVRARNLEREFGIRQLYLKFEGGNPTGTHKDRIAFAQCMDALRRQYDTITVATCGNYGVATAFAGKLAGLRTVVYIPASYHTRRLDEIEKLGAEIVRVPGDYETAVATSREDALQKEWYDANPGGNNTLLQLQAYGEIAYEIYDILRDAPRAIACPVSNGTVLAGIYKGFVRLHRRGKISRIPRMVTGSSFRKNPIVEAFVGGKSLCEDLSPADIHETDVNEPLINWHAFDGDFALDCIRQTDGWAANVSDRKMMNFARMLKEKEGVHVLPASTAGLISLIEQHKKFPLEPDRYVAVLTGRK